jgi:hypothetical protein
VRESVDGPLKDDDSRVGSNPGHSSVTVTERYGHLKAELFSDKDRGLMAVDLTPGTVVSKTRAVAGGSE